MPAAVIDLEAANDPRELIRRAVQALSEGQIVGVPTETVYGLAASAVNAEAVQRLLNVKGWRPGNPLALAVSGESMAREYASHFPLLAQRLARRCWPGPLTMVLDASGPDSALRRLPELVQKAVSPQGTVGLRVPDHDYLLEILSTLAGPIALSSANRSGEPESVTGLEVAERLGDQIDLILDDGRCKYAQPSTVVRVGDKQIDILRAGVLSEAAVKRCTSLLVLLVCTGNTCRSPMAERLLQDQLARKLGCGSAELEDRGIMVMSAGIAARAGGAPSPEAVAVMQARGLDLSKHDSRSLSETLVRFADLILTMTAGHREAILSRWPEAADKTRLLSREDEDVEDPIGGPLELYLQCAEQIDRYLTPWLDRFDLRDPPQVYD